MVQDEHREDVFHGCIERWVRVRCAQDGDVITAIKRSRYTKGPRRTFVSNRDRVSGVLAFKEGLGVGWTLSDDGRVGKDCQLKGEHVLFIHRVTSVFIWMVQSQRKVPAITWKDVRWVGGVDHKLYGVRGDPRLSNGERDAGIGTERGALRTIGRHVEWIVGVVNANGEGPTVL